MLDKEKMKARRDKEREESVNMWQDLLGDGPKKDKKDEKKDEKKK